MDAQNTYIQHMPTRKREIRDASILLGYSLSSRSARETASENLLLNACSDRMKRQQVVDFPGMCFASTRCATIEPNKTWELSPFCGRSTCIAADDNSGRLFELVEDCGPLPKANPKCKLSDKTNKTASFPDCCPIFECEEGAKLEYPEIPTLPPPTEIFEIEKITETSTAKA
uniref:Single domain-containing protein n=1 Tax=Vespula pensylvanica TaxID=30213 RepID=A0A834U514_VESPE|nr:hypothetical protein H0235_011397 [Vespula pensylvanica]